MNTEPARADDLAGIRWLLGFDGLLSEDLTEQSLAYFLVCREKNAIIGAVGLEPYGNIALLRSLVVAEDARGRGVGALLTAAAEALALRLQNSSVYLLTTNAEPFFKAHGYRRIEREQAPAQIKATTQFSALCPSTAILMVKP